MVVANLGCHQTDSYATINNISINFDNTSGLLRSMILEQLFSSAERYGKDAMGRIVLIHDVLLWCQGGEWANCYHAVALQWRRHRSGSSRS